MSGTGGNISRVVPLAPPLAAQNLVFKGVNLASGSQIALFPNNSGDTWSFPSGNVQSVTVSAIVMSNPAAGDKVEMNGIGNNIQMVEGQVLTWSVAQGPAEEVVPFGFAVLCSGNAAVTINWTEYL